MWRWEARCIRTFRRSIRPRSTTTLLPNGITARTQFGSSPEAAPQAALGSAPLAVNSFHHQAIRDLAKGLVATGWTEDGLIEAVETAPGAVALGGAVASGGDVWRGECAGRWVVSRSGKGSVETRE